jgi:bifunctional UDP-N-acetylglucosamine pyrophosphorylase/glucosamine-1-phosphate N-acetyltransferase
MKVAILSAGRSKRLKPVNDKGLLKFNGKSLLEHRLESFASEGFTDFIIVAGSHNVDAINDLVAKHPFDTKVVVQQNLDEGMAGAIKAIESVYKDGGLLIVSNNDTTDQSLIRALSLELEQKPQGLIVAKKVHSYFPGGYIEVDKDGNLKSIIEKPEPGTEPSDLVNLVYHYYADPTELFELVKTAKIDTDDIYEKSLFTLVKNGNKFKVMTYNGFWQAIKTPQDIISTARYFAHKESSRGIDSTAEIHPTAVISGEVIICAGAKIGPNAVIQGPVFIGKNTIVGVNSFVRDSFIGDNCVVGYSCEVARSYIADNSWFHQSYVGDSVIGKNVSFGGGTITGNLRLDEAEIVPGHNKVGIITGDNIRIGINVSLMPGIKIGSDTMIAGGLVIGQDIPEKSFVKGETTLVIKENNREINIR